MAGDFSRSTFDPRKHYNRVLLQQGRAQLDADWNEHADILAHRNTTQTVDMIGLNGTPGQSGGFALDLCRFDQGYDLSIRPGRFYVHGVQCELEPASLVCWASRPHPISNTFCGRRALLAPSRNK